MALGYTDGVTFNSLVGSKNQTSAYTQSLDLGNLLSSNLVASKNQTYAYIQTNDINITLSSNLTGVNNTRPIIIQFSSAIPYVRLNISNNIPSLKQVFVE